MKGNLQFDVHLLNIFSTRNALGEKQQEKTFKTYEWSNFWRNKYHKYKSAKYFLSLLFYSYFTLHFKIRWSFNKFLLKMYFLLYTKLVVVGKILTLN